VDDASRALACGREILAEAERWSEERFIAGKPPVSVGIGGHFGEVFAGALGNDQLLEYTVIGDTVNVAERLERLSREVESPLVVSVDLLKSAGGNQEEAGWRKLPTQMLRGHKTPVDAVCLVSNEHPAT
jgi:adenylate cyclase